jgi:response regulator RpfG family c-di-GMP phosphodiesterase
VDDEREVHEITKLVLSGVTFNGRCLTFLHAYTSHEAISQIASNPDIAVALVDVVMDGDSAGLRVIDHVRNVLCNKLIRLILRTGQPGSAPEKEVLVKYEINDYKTKDELSATKLFSTVVTALRNYMDLSALEESSRGIDRVLEATSAMFRARTLERMAEVALTKLASLLNAGAGQRSNLTVRGSFVRKNSGAWSAVASLGEPGLFDEIGKSSSDDDGFSQIVKIELDVDDESFAIWFNPGRELTVVEQSLIQLFRLNTHGALRHLLTLLQVEIAQHMAVMAISTVGLNISAQCENVRRLDTFASSTPQLENDFLVTLAVQGEVAQWGTQKRAMSHLLRVKELSLKVAEALKLEPQFCQDLCYASQFHDIGNVFVPVYDAGSWFVPTATSRDKAEKHALAGMSYLRNLRSLHPRRLSIASEIAAGHHESWNGAGFPKGVVGDCIPISARIVAAVDFWDTYTHANEFSNRPAYSKAETLEMLSIASGYYFDPRVVDALKGCLVQLNDVDHVQNSFGD